MSIHVDGLNEAVRNFKKAEGDMNELKDALQGIGREVAQEAQSLAPKRTGRLAAGIKASRRQNAVAVASGGTFYHRFQHFGTKHIKANPYLYDAISNKETVIVEQFERNVEKVLEVFDG